MRLAKKEKTIFVSKLKNRKKSQNRPPKLQSNPTLQYFNAIFLSQSDLQSISECDLISIHLVLSLYIFFHHYILLLLLQ